MRSLLGWLMTANAAVFFFGAVQHAGMSIGPFHEPRIVPATIVEGICGLSLLLGATAVLGQSANPWRRALIANLVALSGVLIGIGALAAGAGPRTASNDLYHMIMLVLIGASLVTVLSAGSILRRR